MGSIYTAGLDAQIRFSGYIHLHHLLKVTPIPFLHLHYTLLNLPNVDVLTRKSKTARNAMDADVNDE